MKVDLKEYESLIGKLKDPNYFTKYPIIPKDENIYEINLDTRVVKAPVYVGAENDHAVEIVWFKADRFFGTIDLFESTIVVRYTNADGENFVSLVSPMVITDNDITLNDQTPSELYANSVNLIGLDEKGSEKIFIPWVISNNATQKKGALSFGFQFFKLNGNHNDFEYILNTQIAKTSVLASSLGNKIASTEAKPEPELLDKIWDAYSTLSKEYELYWLEAN